MVCDIALSRAKNCVLTCLNPYSIGIWSATSKYIEALLINYYSLNPYSIGIWSATHAAAGLSRAETASLNPYSIGIWSATPKIANH